MSAIEFAGTWLGRIWAAMWLIFIAWLCISEGLRALVIRHKARRLQVETVHALARQSGFLQ